MTEQQSQALGQLFGLLAGMASEKHVRASEDKKTPFLPVIHEHKTNRCILIDGKRGSGKTAVLVTAIDMLNKRVRGKRDTKLAQHLPDDAPPIIPLDLIDLQPLPPGTNLLLRLVLSFSRLVEHLDGEPSAGHMSAPVWATEGPDGTSQLSRRWSELLQAVSEGWDKEASGRRQRLDVDAHVSELQEAVRQQRQVGPSLQRFINLLARSYLSRVRRDAGEREEPADQLLCDGSPLFVIALDDADMSVEHLDDLLGVLRTLWHDRLALLLTGDSALFEERVRVRCEKEQELSPATAQEIGRQAIDKLVPKGHRCHLPPAPAEQRFNLLKQDERRLIPEAMVAGASEEDLKEGFREIIWDLDRLDPELLHCFPDNLREAWALYETLRDNPDRGLSTALEAIAENKRDIERSTWPGDTWPLAPAGGTVEFEVHVGHSAPIVFNSEHSSIHYTTPVETTVRVAGKAPPSATHQAFTALSVLLGPRNGSRWKSSVVIAPQTPTAWFLYTVSRGPKLLALQWPGLYSPQEPLHTDYRSWWTSVRAWARLAQRLTAKPAPTVDDQLVLMDEWVRVYLGYCLGLTAGATGPSWDGLRLRFLFTWIGREEALLVAAPEFGLPAPVCDRVLDLADAILGDRVTGSVASQLTSLRRTFWTKVLGRKGETRSSELDAVFVEISSWFQGATTHPWYERIEPKPSEPGAPKTASPEVTKGKKPANSKKK